MSNQRLPQVGDVLHEGKYTLLERLDTPPAEGSPRNLVFKARQRGFEYPVVVKMLAPGQNATESERFQREAQRNQRLGGHSAFPAVSEFVQEEHGPTFYVRKFIEGKTLDACARTLSPKERADLVFLIGDALAYCQRHDTPHRDVKLGNIIIQPDGKPILFDFGRHDPPNPHKGPPADDSAALAALAYSLGEPEHNPGGSRFLSPKLERLLNSAVIGRYAGRAHELYEDMCALRASEERSRVIRKRWMAAAAGVLATLSIGAGFVASNPVSREYARRHLNPTPLEGIVDNVRAGPDEVSDEVMDRFRRIAVRSKVRDDINTIPYRIFPIGTNGLTWHGDAESHASDGFWAGIALEGAQLVGDQDITNAAHAITQAINITPTDERKGSLTPLRFYQSHVLAYQLTGEQRYKDTALEAAALISANFDADRGYLRFSNGPMRIDSERISDAVPLLEFADKEAGRKDYGRMARSQMQLVLKYNVKSDGSVVQFTTLDEGGNVIRSFSPGADKSNPKGVHARTQALVLSGLIDAYEYRRDPDYLSRAQAVADYLIGHLPQGDCVPFYDLQLKDGVRDSSAATIAANVLPRLAKHTNNPAYEHAARKLRHSLIAHHVSTDVKQDGIFTDGCLSFNTDLYPRAGLTVTDFYGLKDYNKGIADYRKKN